MATFAPIVGDSRSARQSLQPRPVRSGAKRGPRVISKHGTQRPYRDYRLPDGRFVLWKRVAPQHELRCPSGVACDERVLLDARRGGDAGGAVYRERTGEVLWAVLDAWERGRGISRGYGPQRALRWRDLQPVFGTAPPDSPRVEQVALWGSGP